MTDTIYNNEKPLGLMDPALRKELREYAKDGGLVERYKTLDEWVLSHPCHSMNAYRAVKEPEVTKGWQNVYPSGGFRVEVGVDLYSRRSRECADNDAAPDRIAVIRTETIDEVSKVYLEDV